jgi:hypothetical protein
LSWFSIKFSAIACVFPADLLLFPEKEFRSLQLDSFGAELLLFESKDITKSSSRKERTKEKSVLWTAIATK